MPVEVVRRHVASTGPHMIRSGMYMGTISAVGHKGSRVRTVRDVRLTTTTDGALSRNTTAVQSNDTFPMQLPRRSGSLSGGWIVT
jgi:hypothetical protein